MGGLEKGPLTASVQGTVSTKDPRGHEQQGGQSRRVDHNRVRDNALQLPGLPTQTGGGAQRLGTHSTRPSSFRLRPPPKGSSENSTL